MAYKRKPSRVRLTEHFIERWNERVCHMKESKIKSVLYRAVREGNIVAINGGKFGVQVYGSTAILTPEAFGYWRAITVRKEKKRR